MRMNGFRARSSSVPLQTVALSSDRLGAYPATDPVTPGDLAGTIYWRFGFDPASEVHDQLGRPIRLSDGEPIRNLFVG